MTHNKPDTIELLAPARDIEVGRKAILCGADAVYIGASSHGARAAAGNSVDDIARLVEMAHGYGVKIYVTVNTIVYDNEIAGVERLIHRLYRAGVDALIVQDMGILRMDIPPIDLHASTQCDIRDAAKARFLADVGFSRVVLARELSLNEIAEIHRSVDVELEAFLHGALCVSYSGDCRASFAATGRSANRGECAQICRLKFDLTDSRGNALAPASHYLSLRDLNRINDLEGMIGAGVSSLKIEGRLKDENYVMNAVAAYSRRLDEIVAAGGGKLARASYGRSSAGFIPSLDKGFNRGFTSYFFSKPSQSTRMASLQTPKMTGRPVATVVRTSRDAITVKAGDAIVNGDGLGFFTPAGVFTGFRVNRAEGNRIFPASKINVSPGTTLYRNRDKAFDDMIADARPERTVSVDMSLRICPDATLSLTIVDEAGHRAVATATLESTDAARTDQREARRRILSKLGDTRFRLNSVDDLAGNIFIPASVLTSLRRDAVAALDEVVEATYSFRYRSGEVPDARAPKEHLTVNDNVANRLAREFYARHGVTSVTPALEVTGVGKEEQHVMTTRYCIRRELGCCLKSDGRSRMPADMMLRAPGINLRLEFDCANCRMNVYSSKAAPERNESRNK